MFCTQALVESRKYPGTWNAFSAVGMGSPWLKWCKARNDLSVVGGVTLQLGLVGLFKGIIRVSHMKVQFPVHEAWKKVSQELKETDVTSQVELSGNLTIFPPVLTSKRLILPSPEPTPQPSPGNISPHISVHCVHKLVLIDVLATIMIQIK